MKKRSHIIVTAIAFSLTFGTLVAAKGAIFMHHNHGKFSHCDVQKHKSPHHVVKKKIVTPTVSEQPAEVNEQPTVVTEDSL
jgi:hypothetical protein